MKQLLLLIALLGMVSCTCFRSSPPVNEIKSPEVTSPKINSDTFIEIKMEGGGFYGGANPVTENTKLIKSDGTVVIRNKQMYTGSKESTFSIPRVQVEELAKLIYDNGFFSMKILYDCDKSNRSCQDRKIKYPPAVPLKIDVTIGQVRKQVTVTVFEKGMVEYPDEFALIANRIDELTNREKLK
ncbi:MAG TPA: hypothetical protein VF369_01070 [candidate division Zixibacteria bacterium]